MSTPQPNLPTKSVSQLLHQPADTAGYWRGRWLKWHEKRQQSKSKLTPKLPSH